MQHEVHVIIQCTFVSNSEIAYPPDEGGGHPQLAYQSRKLADEACARMDLQAKRAEWLASLAYDINDIIGDIEGFHRFLKLHDIPHPNDGKYDCINDIEGLSETGKNEMAMFINISFYEVYSVPLEQTPVKPKKKKKLDKLDERFKNLDI